MLGHRRTVLASILLVLFVGLNGFADDDPIVGKYQVAGKLADGSEYTGTVVVSKRGESFELKWGGGLDCTGVGLLDGDTFAAYYTCGGEKSTGAMLFRKKENAWHGKFVRVAGKGLLHTEIWTPVK